MCRQFDISANFVSMMGPISGNEAKERDTAARPVEAAV
jgi:hypothetical protein